MVYSTRVSTISFTDHFFYYVPFRFRIDLIEAIDPLRLLLEIMKSNPYFYILYFRRNEDIPIYNYVSKDNPITFDELKYMTAKYGIPLPSKEAIWYYSFRNVKYRLVYILCIYFLHLLPALLIDTFSLCIGKQPR